MRNVELKARDGSPQRSLEVCHQIGAQDHGELWQRDTYFDVSHGALKLREERPGSPHLIQYERANRPDERESRYLIAPLADAAGVCAVLGQALGVVATVTKRRRLFIWHSVRIHLDDVETLGCFRSSRLSHRRNPISSASTPWSSNCARCSP